MCVAECPPQRACGAQWEQQADATAAAQLAQHPQHRTACLLWGGKHLNPTGMTLLSSMLSASFGTHDCMMCPHAKDPATLCCNKVCSRVPLDGTD